MGKWSTFRQLTWRQRLVFARALLYLPLAGLLLHGVGFKRLCSALDRRTSCNRGEAGDEPAALARARDTARLVQAAARYGLYRATCVPQSLVLWWLLGRHGLRTDLCLGVRKTEGRLEAHAWVEHAGAVINDAEDVRDRFAPFDRLVTSHCTSPKAC